VEFDGVMQAVVEDRLVRMSGFRPHCGHCRKAAAGLAAMPYDMVERSMTAFGEEVVPRIRHVLDRNAAADRTVAAPALLTG
jgi:hypothetical protein